MKRALQEWLIKNSASPVVLWLGRGFYRMGLTCLTWRLRRITGVTLIALRRGMNRADWVPGGSDIDLTVALREGAPAQSAARVYHTLKNFRRVFPIPTDAGVFSETELLQYLAEGNARAIEARYQWKALYGNLSLPEEIRSTEEIALHAYAEAVDQFQRLLALVLEDKPYGRYRTRNFLKHVSDVLVFCDFARCGRFYPSDSRTVALQNILSRGKNFSLLRQVKESVSTGYTPLAAASLDALIEESFEALRLTAECPRFARLAPCWKSLGVSETPNALRTRLVFWGEACERAKAGGVFPSGFHFHDRMFVILEKRPISASPLLGLLRKMGGAHSPLPVTETMLRVLSNTSFYQQYVFEAAGFRLSTNSGEPCERIEAQASERVFRALRARLRSYPAELRQAEAKNPSDAKLIREAFLPKLERAVRRLQSYPVGEVY